MAEKFQIVQVLEDGRIMVYHPETNADLVKMGEIYKVPKITEIEDWIEKSKEIVDARKGKSNLLAKINSMDTSLEASNLLIALKTVDGAGSDLDADKVDGRNVDDLQNTVENLWTAYKTNSELIKKLSSSEVVTSPEPNKILKLDGNSKLPCDITGNSNTATSLKNAIRVNLVGDVTATFNIKGNEANNSLDVSVEVKDDSHNHTSISFGNSKAMMSGTGIIDFIKNGVTLSSIDKDGNFTGSSQKLNGKSINDEAISDSIWTSGKILTELAKDRISISESKNEIQLGKDIVIKYGTIVLGSGTTHAINFNGAYSRILFDNFNIESADLELKVNKVVDGTTNTKIEYISNKVATGKLNWFAVGIV